MKVEFREFDPFNVWIWIEFPSFPTEREKQYIEEVFNSWFFLGKLGAFDAENLPIQDAGLDISYMTYSDEKEEGTLMSLMHNMGEFEYERNWGRCWFDLGTSDSIALDMLINALRQLNKDFLQLETVIFGGQNKNWPIPGRNNPEFIDDEWN
jgi:hypothetical protein